jgi:hypothetical protein
MANALPLLRCLRQPALGVLLALVLAASAGAAWQPSQSDLRVISLDATVNDEGAVIVLHGTVNSRLLSAGYVVTVRAVFHVAQLCEGVGGAEPVEVEADLGPGAYTLGLPQPEVHVPPRQERWSAELRASPNLLPGYTNVCPIGSAPATGYVRIVDALVVVYPGPLAPPEATGGGRLLILFEVLDGTTRISVPKGIALCSCRVGLLRNRTHG